MTVSIYSASIYFPLLLAMLDTPLLAMRLT